MKLVESITDNRGSKLIGASGYEWKHESDSNDQHARVWVSEHVPNEIIHAVKGTASPDNRFPTTIIKEAALTPCWPLVKEAIELEIWGNFLHNKAWDVVP